jgi:hypothetical protein
MAPPKKFTPKNRRKQKPKQPPLKKTKPNPPQKKGGKNFPKKTKKTFLPLQELANDGKPNFCKSTTTLIFDLQVLVICKFKS